MPKMQREDMVAVFVDHQEGTLLMTPKDERKLLEMHLRFMLKGMDALGVPVVICSNLEDGAGRGLHTYVAMDLCGSPARSTATVAMHRLTQIGASPVTAFGAVNEMMRDYSSPTGLKTMKVIFEEFVFSERDIGF